MRLWIYCIVALLAPPAPLFSMTTQSMPAPEAGEAVFNIFVYAQPVGTENVSLSRADGEWIVSSTGRVSGALDLIIRQFEMRYDSLWKPVDMMIDSVVAGEPYMVRTSFSETVATSEVMENGNSETKKDPVSEQTVVLPANIFGAYEALAARLAVSSPNTIIPTYYAPQAEITISLNRVSDQRITTASKTLDARRHYVTILNPNNPFDAEIWTDRHQRLLRISMPTVGLEIIRSDIAAVTARPQTVDNENDEDLHIPATGFNLGATLTYPKDTQSTNNSKWPAVILVPGSVPMDRDGMVSGVPILGQLAGGLANAGFLVVRYDKRGFGQSGGRSETATLNDYAGDVRDVVQYLRRRDDVNDRHIAVVGHADGAWIAMLAASKERRITALGLIAAPSKSGAEIVLEQQQQMLQRMSLTDAERQEKIALQQDIHAAAISGSGWDAIPLAMRQSADTAWFRSYLTFDPWSVLKETRQPVIIAHGTLDHQVIPEHADRLRQFALARSQRAQVKQIRLDNVNHLLLPAITGHIEEYDDLVERTISRELILALAAELHGFFQ